MAFVLDVSVTGSWAVGDETSLYAEMVEWKLIKDTAVVPPVWWYETRNFLVVSERRKRLRPEESARFLALLAAYPIEIDSLIVQENALKLARRHRLSVYDAAYLELAARRGLPLATLDRALQKAAKSEGVALLR